MRDIPEASYSNEPGAYEHTYIKQRKRKRALIWVLVVVIALMIGGFIAYENLGPHHRHHGGTFGANASSLSNRFNVTRYFNSDGSVNTQRVNKVLSKIPSQDQSQALTAISSKIDTAVSNGQITSAQGSTLKQSFGIQ